VIVTAVALLVLAAIFLVIGILSSSIAWLVISLVATVAAAATLYASFVHYRDRAGTAGGPAGYPDAYATSVQVPVAAPAPVYVAAPPATSAAVLPEGWSDRPAAELARVVGALSLDELNAARREEVEGKRRKTVLAAIDARIDEIVDVRRTLQRSSPG
jgi:hypothetical protein